MVVKVTVECGQFEVTGWEEVVGVSRVSIEELYARPAWLGR